MRSFLRTHGSALRIGLLVGLTFVLSSARLAAAPYVTVLEQDDSGVTLRVDLPRSAIRLGTDDQGYRTAAIDGLWAEAVTGRPPLPVVVASLAVPRDAELGWTVDAPATLRLDGPPMRAVPRAVLPEELGEPEQSPLESRVPTEATVGETVSVERVRFRGLDVARLVIRPLRYDPAGNQLLWQRRLNVRIDFAGGRGFASAAGGALGTIEERAVRHWLVNGATWLAARAANPPAGDGEQPHLADRAATGVRGGSGTPGVKLRVDRRGLVRVTGAELEAIGYDRASVDPSAIEVSYRGSAIPCRVTGESDGVFDPLDAIEFFAWPGTGLFSSENVFWIGENPSGGLRYSTVDGTPGGGTPAISFPHTDHYEEGNGVFTYGNAPNVVEGEPHYFWVWFEDNPNPPRVTTFSHVGQVTDLDPGGTTAVFRASFTGRTSTSANPDHKVRFFVNGSQIGETTWDGQAFHTAELPFDPALLVAGANTFRMDYVSVTFPDIYYLDWFEIEYPRLTLAAGDRLTIDHPAGPALFDVDGLASVADPVVLDVADPMAPELVSGAAVGGAGPYTISFEPPQGGTFLVAGDGGRIAPVATELDAPSDLRNTANGADLIIVVPEGWEPTLAPLVAYRQAQGLRVVVASLTDLADEFAGGNVDDAAIRDFVRYAYDNWQAPAVSYLLLVGEANRDPQNWLGQSPFYFFMPTHSGVTDSLGLTTTDSWFGAVSGADLLPDVAVGRFSVRQEGDAATLAAKIISYEDNPPAGAAWGKTILHVASDEQVFEDALENTLASLPAQLAVHTEYRRSGATTSSIRSAFDGGVLVGSFLGHGNVSFWADNPGGSFFTNDHVDSLSNAGRLPLVTALNCINGFIAHPTVIDSMAEVWVNRAVDGAIATWTPSSLGYLDEYDWVEQELYEAMFQQHVAQPGLAATQALVQTYLTRPVGIDLVKKMIFLGDPSGWLMLDFDDDLLPDRDELLGGLGVADQDTDDDGLPDGLEGGVATDTDGDGSANALDADSDNDGLPDGLEAGVDVPGPDTDTTTGDFRADLDPATTTDPLSADTDGGGAPDGIEDLDADGAVDVGETDPQNGLDDPVCASATPGEIAAVAPELLGLSKTGDDIVLTWGDASASTPCVLYHVYVAEGAAPPTEPGAYRLLGVTATPTYTHRGAAVEGPAKRYVVAGATLVGGEGPWGHFE